MDTNKSSCTLLKYQWKEVILALVHANKIVLATKLYKQAFNLTLQESLRRIRELRELYEE